MTSERITLVDISGCNSMQKDDITVSAIPKTWILDLDGTLVKHNGYIIDGYDTLLEGVPKLLNMISPKDMVIIITSREELYKEKTESFLYENNVRYNKIIWGAPYGERILINDKKPSGLLTAIAINKDRDTPLDLKIHTDESL